MENDDLTKEEKIKKEIRRLSGLFTKIDAKAKKAVKSLIENAAFMAITLQDLQDTINEKGVIEEYQNGANQHGFKKSSEVEIYNAMIKNYSSIIKQLTDLLPKAVPVPSKEDGLDKFIASK